MLHFNIILGLTACYFAVILGFVLYARVKSTNSILPCLNEFFLAGKNLSPLVLTFTYLGSVFSTFSILGMPGIVYVHGLGGTVFYLSLAAAGIVLYFIISKKLRAFAAEKRIFSPLEAISQSYNSRQLGFFMAAVFTIFFMPYISLQLVGAGAFISAYTDGAITYVTGVGSMMLIVFIYLFLGGMRAVAYTDFVQITTSFLGLALGLWLFMNHFDLSLLSILDGMKEISPAHLSLPGPAGLYNWPFLITVSIITGGIFIQPHLLTRAMMAQNDKQINFMGGGIILGYLIAGFLTFFLGVSAYLVLGTDLQPNFVTGHIFKELATLGMLGLFVSALMLMGALGASMSTADSLLIAIGQISTRDMVRPFFQISPKKQVILSKAIMGIILLTAFIVGLQPPRFMTDLAIYSAAGSAIMVPTIINFRWKHRSTLASFASISIGLVLLVMAVIYKFQTGTPFAGVHEGTFPLIASFVIYYGICFVKNLAGFKPLQGGSLVAGK